MSNKAQAAKAPAAKKPAGKAKNIRTYTIDGNEYEINLLAAQSSELFELAVNADAAESKQAQMKLIYDVYELTIVGGLAAVKSKLKKDGFTPMPALIELFPKLMEAIEGDTTKNS
jgi:hypothetical protein